MPVITSVPSILDGAITGRVTASGFAVQGRISHIDN